VEVELFHHLIDGLKYQFIPKDKLIFEKGSTGHKFYIILQGIVTVALPKLEYTLDT